jgi:hypothetical protein
MWQAATNTEGSTMPTAEEVAILLAYEFLRKGNYSAAAGPIQMPELVEMAPATARRKTAVAR